MLCSFFTDSIDNNSIFSLIDFFVLIISIIFGFIIFTFLCFYSVLRTALTFLIMNMIIMSIVYTGRILFNNNSTLQMILFISSTFSITITLSVLLFLAYNKVIKQKCHDKGYCYTKFIFFFICDIFPFIIGIIFVQTQLIEIVLCIYSVFLIIMMLINLILGIRMISIVNHEETKRTRQYPIRISFFILVHFLTNINLLIIGVLTIINENIKFFDLYIQLADFFTNLQALFYSISFIFYPRVISVIKGLLIKKKPIEPLPAQSIYHSVFDIDNTNSQSLTQTIYD